jgi:hypothetical protein
LDRVDRWGCGVIDRGRGVYFRGEERLRAGDGDVVRACGKEWNKVAMVC